MKNKELEEIIAIFENHHLDVTDDLTIACAKAINQHIYKEVMELIGEDEETFDDLGVGKNELRDELRAAAKKRFLDE